jgi:hypothetical protein
MPDGRRADSEPIKVVRPKLLLGEGQDEVRLFRSLLKHLAITDVQAEEYGGKTNLSPYLRAVALQDEFQTGAIVSLGITRDADQNAASALQSVKAALSQANLTVPALAESFAGAGPRIGVLILPGGGRDGMLEDLCLDAVQNDPAISCLDDYFACIQKSVPVQPKNMAKARVHAWLASRPVPDRRLGEAAEKGDWPWDDPAFEPLKQFLRAL